VLAHSPEELGDARPDKNVDLAYLPFDLDWQFYIGVLDWLEL